MGCSNTSPVPDDSGVQLRGVDVNNVEGSTDGQLSQQGQGVAVDHGKHTCVWGGQITLVKTTIRTGLSNGTFYWEGAWNIQIHLHRPTRKVLPNTHTRIHACMHACVHTHTHRHSCSHTVLPLWFDTLTVIQEPVRFTYSREAPNTSVPTGSKRTCHRCYCPWPHTLEAWAPLSAVLVPGYLCLLALLITTTAKVVSLRGKIYLGSRF